MSELAELIEEMRNGRYGKRFLPNPPLTMAEIVEAEKQLLFPLPSFYKEFLLLANGGDFDNLFLFGIHPAGRHPRELLHPETWGQYRHFVAATKLDGLLTGY